MLSGRCAWCALMLWSAAGMVVLRTLAASPNSSVEVVRGRTAPGHPSYGVVCDFFLVFQKHSIQAWKTKKRTNICWLHFRRSYHRPRGQLSTKGLFFLHGNYLPNTLLTPRPRCGNCSARQVRVWACTVSDVSGIPRDVVHVGRFLWLECVCACALLFGGG